MAENKKCLDCDDMVVHRDAARCRRCSVVRRRSIAPTKASRAIEARKKREAESSARRLTDAQRQLADSGYELARQKLASIWRRSPKWRTQINEEDFVDLAGPAVVALALRFRPDRGVSWRGHVWRYIAKAVIDVLRLKGNYSLRLKNRPAQRHGFQHPGNMTSVRDRRKTELAEKEEREVMDRIGQLLPSKYRAVWIGRLEGLTFKEIGQSLQLSEARVSQLFGKLSPIAALAILRRDDIYAPRDSLAHVG